MSAELSPNTPMPSEAGRLVNEGMDLNGKRVDLRRLLANLHAAYPDVEERDLLSAILHCCKILPVPRRNSDFEACLRSRLG